LEGFLMIPKFSMFGRLFFREVLRPFALPLVILLAFLAGGVFGCYLLKWSIEDAVAAGSLDCPGAIVERAD
jgi:hypothetical protein